MQQIQVDTLISAIRSDAKKIINHQKIRSAYYPHIIFGKKHQKEERLYRHAARLLLGL